MPDRTPPRRPLSATERVLAEARGDVPVEIDPELTPAPASIPTPAARAQMTADDRIAALEEAAAANAAAVAHEQRARREGKLEAKVDALAGVAHDVVRATAVLDQTVLPAVRELGFDMRAILEERQYDRAQREEVSRRLDSLGKGMGAVEQRLGAIDLLDQRVDALGANLQDLAGRVTRVEARTNNLDTRQRISVALTRRDKAKVGGLGAGAGGIAGLVLSNIETIARWVAHFFH